MKKNSYANALKESLAREWILLASRTDAVIYEEGSDHEFHFVERLSNPKGSKTEQELASDRPGRVFSSSGGAPRRHGLEQKEGRHETAAKRFAKKIAERLRDGRNQDRYDRLVIAAEPHFLGLLRLALSPQVNDALIHEIPREFLQGSDHEIRGQLLRWVRERGA